MSYEVKRIKVTCFQDRYRKNGIEEAGRSVEYAAKNVL